MENHEGGVGTEKKGMDGLDGLGWGEAARKGSRVERRRKAEGTRRNGG
jgi:hypothetical protein